MPDRLADLRHQRALIQEHLAWLDREVAALERDSNAASRAVGVSTTPEPFVVGVNTVPSAPRVVPTAAISTPTIHSPIAAAPSSPALAAADDILDQYRVEPNTLKQDIRKGCFLYFAAAMGLLALGVLILYFALRSK